MDTYDTKVDEMGDVFCTKDRAVLPFWFIALNRLREPPQWRKPKSHWGNSLISSTCLELFVTSWARMRDEFRGAHTCRKMRFTYMYNASPHFRTLSRPDVLQTWPACALMRRTFFRAPPEKRHVCLIPLNNSLGVGTAAALWRNIPSTRAMWQYSHVEQRNATIAALPDKTTCHTRKRPDLSVLMRDDKQAFYSFMENLCSVKI